MSEPRMYDPYSGRGRRKTNVPPSTGHQAMMREKQRLFRQRKQNYLENLERHCKEQESEIKQLRTQLADWLSLDSPSNSSKSGSVVLQIPESPMHNELHPSPSAPRCANPDCQALRTEIVALRKLVFSENVNASNQPDNDKIISVVAKTALTSTNPFNDANYEWLINPKNKLGFNKIFHALDSTAVPLSSEQLHGPIDIENFRKTLRTLDSLKESITVDNYCDMLVSLSRETDIKRMRQLFLRIMREKNRIMDLCTVIDRVKFGEAGIEYRNNFRPHFVGFILYT
ncbi:hypothetical protein HK100_001712 [Physocladia obscura]|uniref:BZIP domain-containing protein n=1 Tax=Physocladia obscura TaxID=109957 RepID=A0AAD5T8W2_9FUNG|nr:hypothetical protein HK100_001712 [Physocladia obscura]